VEICVVHAHNHNDDFNGAEKEKIIFLIFERAMATK
jgi:hypothetical protein